MPIVNRAPVSNAASGRIEKPSVPSITRVRERDREKGNRLEDSSGGEVLQLKFNELTALIYEGL